MSSETLIFDAYSAYLDIVQQVAGNDFDVYDGPQSTFPGSPSFVAVGVDDINNLIADVVAVDAGAQDWAALGAGSRDENFNIHAVLFCWDGQSAALPTLRAKSNTFLQNLGEALRQPPRGTGDAMLNGTLNQGGAGTGWCGGLVPTDVRVRRSSSGVAVVTHFALPCYARI